MVLERENSAGTWHSTGQKGEWYDLPPGAQVITSYGIASDAQRVSRYGSLVHNTFGNLRLHLLRTAIPGTSALPM